MSRPRPKDDDLCRIVFGETGSQHERLPPPDYRLARQRLRALLAVARAAERVERLHKRQWNGPGASARRDMARALARLRPSPRRKRP